MVAARTLTELPRYPLVEIVLVTPDLAREWLVTRPYKHQRRLQLRERVLTYAAEMTAGDFRRSSISFGVLNGECCLLNGQHRLHAIVESGTPVECIVDYRFCSSEQELAEEYATFDNGLNRRLTDVLTAHDTGQRYGLAPYSAEKIIAAAKLIANEFRARTSRSRYIDRSRTEQMRLLDEWVVPGTRWLDMFGVSGKRVVPKFLIKMGPMAVGMVTLRHSPDVAQEWWESVRDNDGLRLFSPAHTLVAWINNSATKRFASILPPHMLARYITNAWNAHYEGRSLKLLKVPDAQIAAPISIDGSPFDGKSRG